MRAMLVQRVQQQFIDSADLGYQCAEALGTLVEAASCAVVAAVTGGGKVLACGVGNGRVLAQLLVNHLIFGLERERPALPALLLDTSASQPAAMVRALSALAMSDDLLLLLGDTGTDPGLLALVHAAHERDMTVVALTGAGGGLLTRALRDTDVHVCVPHTRMLRIHEMHHLVLNSLCDGIDAQLLGEAPETENLE
jgi:D-sedoheptulose 7-phosphate isomerase